MINIYKAFILTHIEYCNPVLVGLSSGLSDKLLRTNEYAILLFWTWPLPMLI